TRRLVAADSDEPRRHASRAIAGGAAAGDAARGGDGGAARGARGKRLRAISQSAPCRGDASALILALTPPWENRRASPDCRGGYAVAPPRSAPIRREGRTAPRRRAWSFPSDAAS